MTQGAAGQGGHDAPTEPLADGADRRVRTEPLEAQPQAAAAPPPSPLARAAVLAGAALLLTGVVLLVANALMTRSAEEAAAERAGEVLGAPASVRLQGWPVGLRLATGSPVDAVVQATDVPIEGSASTVSRLVIELDEVVLDRQALEAGTGGMEAARGRFAAELDADAVQQMAGLIGRLPLVGVELRDGVARLSVAGFPVLDATAEVEAGTVVFRPTAPLGSFARVELELGELPLGFRADRVEIGRDVLRLEGSATDIRLGLSPDPGRAARGVSPGVALLAAERGGNRHTTGGVSRPARSSRRAAADRGQGRTRTGP